MKHLFYLFIILLPLSIVAQCEHPDYAGLMEFYNATTGDNWMRNNGWKEGKNGTACDPCDFNGAPWDFVQCQDGRVTKLLITFNNLNGAVPNFSLEKLEEFSIRDNASILGLPNFSKLPELRRIFISKCDLPFPIPDFSALQKIEEIELSNNGHTGVVPDFDLPSLEILNLVSNELSGEIPGFGNAQQLKNILLRGNNLTGAIPNFNLPELSFLNLATNKLSGQLPNFENLAELTSFDCAVNDLEGTFPNFLFSPKINNLNIVENNFTGNVPDFADHPNLNRIVIFGSNNDFEGCYPESVCELAGISFNQNPKLPYRGNFSRICEGESFIGAPCSPDGPGSFGIFDEDCNCIAIDCDYYKSEFDELMKFYDSTNGQDWRINVGWLSGASGNSCFPCDHNNSPWYGIICREGKIVGIDLDGDPNFIPIGVGGNNLSGTLPDFSIETLTRLFLDDNNLTGELPSFSGTPMLENLVVSRNDLSGTLPEFQNFKNLKSFRGSYNNIEGNIPNLKGLDSLKTFSCSNNKLEGCLDTLLCNISVVDLTENELLPWSGNIDTLCLGENQIGAPCNLSSDENYTINDNCECELFVSKTNELDGGGFSCFPNPATDFINIKTASKDVKFIIYDIHATKVLESSYKKIDITHLPRGIYSIIISNERNSVLRFYKI